MKKYLNATSSGSYSDILAMYQDYFTILGQLEDYEKKANAYDSSKMSKEDYTYYLGALNRIQKKLLEIYQ